MAPQKLQRAALSPSATSAASMVTATAPEGGTYGAITPNPRTISGYQGTVKSLHISGVAGLYLRMSTYIMWEGNNFPTSLMISLATPAGEPLPDVELYKIDFF